MSTSTITTSTIGDATVFIVNTATGGIALAIDYTAEFNTLNAHLSSIATSLATIAVAQTAMAAAQTTMATSQEALSTLASGQEGIHVQSAYDWTSAVSLYNYFVTQGNGTSITNSNPNGLSSFLSAGKDLSNSIDKFQK